jgi:tRNA-specific 2-thiouridylase
MVSLTGQAAAADELAWVALTVSGGRITESRGEGDGVFELCRTIRGMTPLEAAAVPGPRLAVDALHDALGPGVRAPLRPGRVAVAMSGGVDSAVALLRVRDAGCEPVGVTLRLWVDPAGPDVERVCCSPSAVVAARESCQALGLPHVTLDLREQFRAAVVARFVAGYARGETPNPCTRCNGTFRFHELLAFMRRVGAERLATGHYARLAEHRGRLLLRRAADGEKDQTYMLATLSPERLRSLWFPLGDQTKSETRAQAADAGLAAARRAESQEACFLGGDDYREFLSRHGLRPASGAVVTQDGAVVGAHQGYWRFTPGQRRGLGVSGTEPVFALSVDSRRNTVVVGPRQALGRRSVSVRNGRLFVPVEEVEAKLRHRSPAARATVAPRARGFRLTLHDPAYGLAPGQTAVLYEDGAVVGAGTIASAQ